MELGIGQVKSHKGTNYQCIKAISGCHKCSFQYKHCSDAKEVLGECYGEYRNDRKNVIFEKIS